MSNEQAIARAVEILRVFNEWQRIGKQHIDTSNPWEGGENEGQGRLYGILGLAVHRREIKDFSVYTGLEWFDNEIGELGRALDE